MDVNKFLTEHSTLIFFLTTLFAFIAWIFKSLIEKPIEDSKNTFNKYIDKRLESLIEVKSLLMFIEIFPTEEDSKEYKQQLQNFLKSGKAVYLDMDTLEEALKISVNLKTDLHLLRESLRKINIQLSSSIGKIQDEQKFYKIFSNFDPLKRIASLTLLSTMYLLSLILIFSTIWTVIYSLLFLSGIYKILVLLGVAIAIYLSYLWLKR